MHRRSSWTGGERTGRLRSARRASSGRAKKTHVGDAVDLDAIPAGQLDAAAVAGLDPYLAVHGWGAYPVLSWVSVAPRLPGPDLRAPPLTHSRDPDVLLDNGSLVDVVEDRECIVLWVSVLPSNPARASHLDINIGQVVHGGGHGECCARSALAVGG